MSGFDHCLSIYLKTHPAVKYILKHYYVRLVLRTIRFMLHCTARLNMEDMGGTAQKKDDKNEDRRKNMKNKKETKK